MHVNTVDRIRRRFVQEGEAPAVNRKVRATPPTPPKLDGRGEAHLVAICCGKAPEGRARWTLKLLVDELKKRQLVTSISVETVRKTLKKTNFNLGGKNAGAFPSDGARFVAQMEDILDLYAAPHTEEEAGRVGHRT